MDSLAIQSLASMWGTGIPVETKFKQLTELKAEIKHRHCPEAAVGPLFDVIRLALATPHLTDAGFSILGHLMKRLELQEQGSLLHHEGAKTYPPLLERLTDPKDRIRQRAIQALTDFHTVAAADVEHFVRDHVLTNRNPRAKEAGMHWVADTRREKNIAFRGFVFNIVGCLEDADGCVRQTAQATIVDLFQNAGTRETNDLQKHLAQRNVRKSIVEHILSQLGPSTVSGIETSSPVEQHGNEVSKATNSFQSKPTDGVGHPPVEPSPTSVSEQEAAQLDPMYVESPRDLEESFREMHPYFEGKECEGNWLKREKSILKLRKLTKGNALQDFTAVYFASIKGLLDGILKTVNSLRTTVCTIGCHLVQDIARVAGHGLDNMVEILLQNLIKLCASTKKIAAANGNDTVAAILGNVTYSIRLTQHIYAACQDKNVQPRSYACGWLKIIITKHGHHKSTIEHAGGLELIEKCLRAGLLDRDPNVRESMRPTYWAFARRWPDKSEAILSGLDERNQKALISNAANPNPDHPLSSQTAGGKPVFSKSTISVPARPSIKETIAAQKQAARAGKNLSARPGSAEPSGSPKKSTSQSSLSRPATAMSTASRNVSTTSVGTLSSAPVRPRRRADIVRPATADPYAHRKLARTETPPRSPAASPIKRGKTPVPMASTVKLAPRKVDSPSTTSPQKASSSSKTAYPGRSHHVNSAVANGQTQVSPTKAAENFTMVIPNIISTTTADFTPPDRSPQSMCPTPSPRMVKLDDPFSPTAPSSIQKTGSPNKKFGWHSASSDDGKPIVSPTKLTGGIGRISINGDKGQRISMSPRAIHSKKENVISTSQYAQAQRPLKVYEDPVNELSNGHSYPSPLLHTLRALEELPVNEPTKTRQALDHQLLSEESQSPEYHQKWLALEAADRRRISASENLEDPRLARKILDSGIERVRTRTLDVHGFRKLQALIRTSADFVWEDGYKFDELIMPLLEYLESPDDEATIRSGKAQDLKTQDLITVRLLLQHQPKYFSGYYSRALTAVLTARRHFNSTSHMVCGLEETAESVVQECDPQLCIESILDLLAEEGTANAAETKTISMALYTLAGLLHRGQEKNSTMRLTNHHEAQLGSTAARFLADTNPDIRRAVIEFVLEFHDTVDHDRFWGLVAGGRDDHRSLITYYLARKRAIVQ